MVGEVGEREREKVRERERGREGQERGKRGGRERERGGRKRGGRERVSPSKRLEGNLAVRFFDSFSIHARTAFCFPLCFCGPAVPVALTGERRSKRRRGRVEGTS